MKVHRLEIMIDMANLLQSCKSEVVPLGAIPDAYLANTGSTRLDVSMVFLKGLHSLEDPR
jgi:hypothetical protein